MVTATVDLSASFATARDQGERPTCLAIALSDGHAKHRAMEHQLLSAEYLFSVAAARMAPSPYYSGLTLVSAQDALRIDGQPEESVHPYVQNLGATEALPALPSPLPSTLFRADTVANLSPAGASTVIANECASGRPVTLVIQVTRMFAGVSGPDYLVRGAPTDIQHGLHGVVALGYGMDGASVPCVKIRNSWGVGWGDNGYAWLHESYLNAHLHALVALSPM